MTLGTDHARSAPSHIQTGLKKYEAARDAKKSKFQSWGRMRVRLRDAVNHLDKYLAEFADKLERAARRCIGRSAAEQAREIIANREGESAPSSNRR